MLLYLNLFIRTYDLFDHDQGHDVTKCLKGKHAIEIVFDVLYNTMAVAKILFNLTVKNPLFSSHTVNLFLMVYQLGSCCVYTVFIATNLQTVSTIVN